MDFSALDTVKGSDEGAALYVRHPITQEITDAWIKLAGPDSRIAKSRRADIRRRFRNHRSSDLDLDALEQEAMETRVAMTLEWGGIELDGEELAFTPENVRTVYERFPWLIEQVDSFQGDRANFMSTNSE